MPQQPGLCWLSLVPRRLGPPPAGTAERELRNPELPFLSLPSSSPFRTYTPRWRKGGGWMEEGCTPWLLWSQTGDGGLRQRGGSQPDLPGTGGGCPLVTALPEREEGREQSTFFPSSFLSQPSPLLSPSLSSLPVFSFSSSFSPLLFALAASLKLAIANFSL